jgi:hypothetical protein
MSTIATTQSVGDKRRAVYWIGGSKGGVGKSMVTFATLDYLLERAASVCLVESDTPTRTSGKPTRTSFL